MSVCAVHLPPSTIMIWYPNSDFQGCASLSLTTGFAVVDTAKLNARSAKSGTRSSRFFQPMAPGPWSANSEIHHHWQHGSSKRRRIGKYFAPPTRALSSLYSFATSEKFSPASSLALASSERESFSHRMCRTLICWKDFCFDVSVVVVLPLAGVDAAAASFFGFLLPPFAPMIALADWIDWQELCR